MDAWIGFVCPVHGPYDPNAPPEKLCPTVVKCYYPCPHLAKKEPCVYCDHRKLILLVGRNYAEALKYKNEHLQGLNVVILSDAATAMAVERGTKIILYGKYWQRPDVTAIRKLIAIRGLDREYC